MKYDQLERRGWMKIQLGSLSAETLKLEMLSIAQELGKPVGLRTDNPIEVLTPTTPTIARSSSLSRRFGLEQFPYHVDTAHWTRPCRIIILACVDPGEHSVPTRVVDWREVPQSEAEEELLTTGIFHIRNGRASFFATARGIDDEFIRFDPGCMHPVTEEAERAAGLFSPTRLSEYSEAITWEKGDMVIVNNWHVLHARDPVRSANDGRQLLRSAVV